MFAAAIRSTATANCARHRPDNGASRRLALCLALRNGGTLDRPSDFEFGMKARLISASPAGEQPRLLTELCGDGDVEERDPREVSTLGGRHVTAEHATVVNAAFDVTPAELVTAFITDSGIIRPPYDFRSKILDLRS